MKRLWDVRSQVAVSLLLMALLVPVSWASGGAHLPQQDQGEGGATVLGAEELVSISGSVGVQISQSTDDAEEERSGPNIDRVRTSGGDLELGTDTGISQLVGMRFANLGIPRYATISDAYIEFTSTGEQTDGTGLTVKIEADDNPPTYKSSDTNISSRTTLGATVNWGGVEAWAPETVYRTPSLRTLVQEHVNRTSWVPGNTLAFQISGFGQRTAYSFDGAATKAPKLVVNFAGSVPCYTLTKNISPAGKGLLTADPEPNCEGGRYYQSTVVSLIAAPNPAPSAANYAFNNWTGAATGTANPTTVTMNTNKTVTANFVTKTCWPLNTAVVPVHAPPVGPVGEIRPDPGFNCGGERYVNNTVVSMGAVAKGGWAFAGWSGALTGVVTPQNLTMNATKTVTAAFDPACRRINVDIKPPLTGTVAFSPDPNCTKSKWHPNTPVQLTANAAPGYIFIKWNGDVPGGETFDNPITVVLDGNKSIDATFREGSYKLWLPLLAKRYRQ